MFFDDNPSPEGPEFELLSNLRANGAIPFYLYKSVHTGITVCIAEVEGPIVNGYFNFATETFDDDGLPHILEHLIFLGSEDYPYKGVLDLLANRCYASGTNAHTERDHTYYTLTTAGTEGFLSLMPVYIEHILYPLLQDTAYDTEVYHINDEGKEAGVVYCEMQGIENTGEKMTFMELLRLLYPGRCGYKSNTGGSLKNLRESSNNNKVRDYHTKFYRPENFTVLIVGKVNHEDVFRAMEPIIYKITRKIPRDYFLRPWQDKVLPLTHSVTTNVFFPCDDEVKGMVYIGWQGPSAVTQIYDCLACTILCKYLSDTSSSPLQREFVEQTDSYASNVSYIHYEYSVSLLCIIFQNVPVRRLHLIEGLLKCMLSDICIRNDIDMHRMQSVLRKSILKYMNTLENDPHEIIANMLFGYTLYGNSEEDLNQRINVIHDLKKLQNEPISFWINLLNRYLVNAPMVASRGIPSIGKKRMIMAEEKNRSLIRQKNLNMENLHYLDEAQLNDIRRNEIIPNDILESIQIPSLNSINFHAIISYNTSTDYQHPKFDVTKLPFFTYLDHVNTNFIYLIVVMDSSFISREYRKYIPLLLEIILNSPIERNGLLIPYYEVVNELAADTVMVSTQIGHENVSKFSAGSYSHNILLMFQLELEKYEKGVQWIRDLLFNVVLTTDRINILASKLINNVPHLKRKGHKVAHDLMKGLLYHKDSNPYVTNMLRQQRFLTNVVERLNNDAEQAIVLAEINFVKDSLLTYKNIVLHIAVNVEKLAFEVLDVYGPWNVFFYGVGPLIKNGIFPDWSLMNDPREICINGCVTGSGCVESSFLCQTCPCITDYNNPDLPALLVCLQYITQVEGPMWRLIRGKGLVYGYALFAKPTEGLMYLTLFRSSDVIAAFKETKMIIESHITSGAWKEVLFESAKSSMIFELINEQRTISDMVIHSLLSYLKKISREYVYELIRHITTLTMQDLTYVAHKYLTKLFDPSTCKITIVCHSSEVNNIGMTLRSMNYHIDLYNSVEETYLNDW